MNRIFVLSFFIFCGSAGLAQDPDAVEWYEIYFSNRLITPPARAFASAETRLDSAIELRDRKEEMLARMDLGFHHLRYAHDYEKAMDLFIQCLTLADSLDATGEQILAYIAIARVFEEVGNAPKSEEMLEEGQLLNRQIQNASLETIILNRLGRVNGAQGKIEDAFKSYEQALELMTDIENSALEAETVFNVANLYSQQGEFDKALDRHKRALAITRTLRDRAAEALSLNDIGELYRLMGNKERAFANHEAALGIRTELKDPKGIATSRNNLGVLHFQEKNFSEAMSNLEKALAAARESQDQEQIRKAHEFLSACYEAQEDFRQALDHKKHFIDITDFIQREKTDRQLLEAQSRYVIEGNQSRIRGLESIREQRENELREQKRFRDFLVAVIALGTVIVFLVVYLYFTIRRSNRRLKVAHVMVQEQNIQLRDLNATKDKFFSIISHDLKGPLNSLTSFSSLLINHTDSLTKDEIRMLASDLDKSLKNLFALLENLLEWSRSQTGNIDFKAERFGIGAMLEDNRSLLASQAQNKKITIENLTRHDHPVFAHRQSINTVVRNLISNAIKFTPAEGKIILQARKTAEGIVVSVADTGVGMSPEVINKLFRIDTKHSTRGTADEKGTGLGLILCREFVEKNGGRIWVESTPGSGTIFYFSVPHSIDVGIATSDEATVFSGIK